MSIINKLLEVILSLMDAVLPTLGLPEEFLIKLDAAMSTIIGFIQNSQYFIPLDTFVMCFSVIIIVDNFALISRIGQWFIKLVRG